MPMYKGELGLATEKEDVRENKGNKYNITEK